LQAGDPVRGHTVHLAVLEQAVSIGVGIGEIKQVNAGKGDEEADQEGDGVDGVGGIKSREEDERGAENGGGEGDIVKRINAGPG
jgi:hypothetical protein